MVRSTRSSRSFSSCSRGLSDERFEGSSHDPWSVGDATGVPIEDFGPTIVFNAAFDGERSFGVRFRPRHLLRTSQSKIVVRTRKLSVNWQERMQLTDFVP